MLAFFLMCASMSALSPAFQNPGQPLLVVSCMVTGGSKCERSYTEFHRVLCDREKKNKVKELDVSGKRKDCVNMVYNTT